MLWVTDPDGSCSYLSRAWSDFTGQSEAEGLGFGWLEMVHPDDRSEAAGRFAAANAGREAFELEHRLRRHDGVHRWVIDAGRPRVRADGTFEGYIGAVIDIHDRKVAEDRLDLAVNSGNVGLWYCDLPFDELQWSAEVKEHFGLPHDARVTLETFYERIHPDDREPTRRAIDASIANQTTYDTQYRTVGLDGRVRWIRAIGRARYDGPQPVSFDGITIDVSELVRLSNEAEEANLAKDEFLAMLGHELRNPLAPILTALQLLKLRGGDAVEHERAILERQVNNLVVLVDDLLDVSRITRGRLQLHNERLHIADVVSRAVEVASPLLEQQRHFLAVDVPRGLLVDGDPARLAQVVSNLLTNAAKYTEAGGKISVSTRIDDGDVVLAVRDTGVGIDPEFMPRIFDRFAQQKQTLARSQGGLGLGLAIVRSLVELHGGRVEARSAGHGQGSEFVVRLPLAEAADEATSAPHLAVLTTSVGAADARVLIVDDNADAAQMLALLVTAFGYQARVAVDALSAIHEAGGFDPHVALVDIGLPIMNGYELAQRLREDPERRHLRLIAVTGYGQERDRESARQAGFDAHLVKPVDAETLRRVLQDMTEARTAAGLPPS